jgi:integrase/recombinase XerC
LYEYAVQKEIINVLPFKYKDVARFGGKAIRTTDITAKSTDKPLNLISIENYKLHWRSHLSGTRNSQRNLALVDLLITAGLRISEALALEVHQIPDPDDVRYRALRTITIRIIGKGGKVRKIRIPKRIVRLIRFYIDEDRGRMRGHTRSKGNPIFLTRTGNPLTVRDAESLFERASKATGLKLTPHGCRHTFAIYQLDSMIKKLASNLRRLKENGLDAYNQLLNDPLRELQRMLGHASIQTTYVYLDFLEASEALVDESLEAWTDWRDDK